MLCVDGRAKAVLDQFEEEKGAPQKYNELKKQLNAVSDSDSDREVHMTAFECCVHRIGENEDGVRSIFDPHHFSMSSFNIIFSKLEKFTGDGNVDLRQWLRNFDRCCVIAEKSEDLVVGQILMLCVDGRAKAVLDQFEEEKGAPQKYSELKKQLNAVFDSDSDREVHMTAFECCVQRIGENEEEFMTLLLQLYKAADPQATTNVINHAVKRKFLQGISDTLRRNIFIFCSDPFDEKVSHQDLLKASRDALVHLSLPSTLPPWFLTLF